MSLPRLEVTEASILMTISLVDSWEKLCYEQDRRSPHDE